MTIMKTQKNCIQCNEVYLAIRIDQRFCSKKCNHIWWDLNNRERKLKNLNEWYQENKEEACEKSRLQYANNKELRKKQIAARTKQRKREDPAFRVLLNLRKRFKVAFNNNQKSGSVTDNLGCSIEDLKKHLESQFKEGMSWSNYGFDGWHVDHIRPLASFDLSDPVQFKEACYYRNLQPLWAEDNLRKGDSYAK